MSKPRNLTAHQAVTVQSAMIAVNFEGATIQIDFEPIDVFVTDAGWITVRGGQYGYEEHDGLSAFETAYALENAQPDLLALAYEMEAMCDAFLLNAAEEGNDLAQATWAKRRDRCRAAIIAAITKSTASRSSATVTDCS
jgi:hypothetical protein